MASNLARGTTGSASRLQKLDVSLELGLPSYEDAAQDAARDVGCAESTPGQSGSEVAEFAGGRFGRWGEWVEKRALERRYQDQDRLKRREARRQIASTTRPPSYDVSARSVLNMPVDGVTTPRDSILSVVSTASTASTASFVVASDEDLAAQETPSPSLPIPFVSQSALGSTSLTRTDYGSRFFSHSTSRITCALTLPGGLVLLGTTTGLRVLVPGLEDPVKPIWTGMAVWDMVVLKQECTSGRTPRGSVLVLCGGVEEASSGRPRRAEARVWKLESLASLAKWSSVQEGFEGVRMDDEKGKGGPTIFRSVKFGATSNGVDAGKTGSSGLPNGYDLAVRWTKDFTTLPSGGRPVLATTVHLTSTEMTIALATSDSIVLHVGRLNKTGSYSFSPPKTFCLPFPPSTVSLVELEIAGLRADDTKDCSSSLFEWDDGDSATSLGEGVSGRVLGLFVSFSGARSCVIRTDDMKIIELKRGGRGDWLSVEKVKSNEVELYIFTGGQSSFVLEAPLTLPLAMQTPLTEISWSEGPKSVRALNDPGAGLRLLGLNADGSIHVLDLTLGEGRSGKHVARIDCAFGDHAMFLPDANCGPSGLPDLGNDEDGHGDVVVGYRKGARDWRIARLGQQSSIP